MPGDWHSLGYLSHLRTWGHGRSPEILSTSTLCLRMSIYNVCIICKVNKSTYYRSICCTQMLWDSSAYLLYLFDWNIILEQEPKYICEHDDSTFLSQAFKLFEPFLRCLDHFEQLTSSSSSFVGEVWFQQDHSGNVHQRPRQGADAFNEVCVLRSQLWLRQRCWACFLEPRYLLWFFGCWAESGVLKEPWYCFTNLEIKLPKLPKFVWSPDLSTFAYIKSWSSSAGRRLLHNCGAWLSYHVAMFNWIVTESFWVD